MAYSSFNATQTEGSAEGQCVVDPKFAGKWKIQGEKE